ncbi:MAG: ORF6N domain-containing protein [Bacteroidia bacterium]
MQLQIIQQKIYEIRGHKVMMDFDLAELYEVETRVLNQAVNRNIERFPGRFMFQLSQKEWLFLKSQIVTSKTEKRGGTQKLPKAFTEHGVTMLASVLRSKKAIKMNIAIVEAFIALKEFALTYKELAEKITKSERKNDKQFKDVYEALHYLLQKDKQETEQKERKRIGYKL